MGEPGEVVDEVAVYIAQPKNYFSFIFCLVLVVVKWCFVGILYLQASGPGHVTKLFNLKFNEILFVDL